VPKADFELATSLLVEAKSESEKILESARRMSDDVTGELEQLLEAQQALLTEEELVAMRLAVDRETVLRLSREAERFIDAASYVRTEFDRLTPWLCDLVELSLQKVLGKLDVKELLAAPWSRGRGC
jgi:hypothetical protein